VVAQEVAYGSSSWRKWLVECRVGGGSVEWELGVVECCFVLFG